jgi:AraC-like DNA-binding protein
MDRRDHTTDSTDREVTERAFGALRIATRRGPAPCVLGRRPEPDAIGVGIQTAGTAMLSRLGSRVPCAPGTVFVVDLSRPWELRQQGAFRQHLFIVPKASVGLTEGDLDLLWGVHGQTGQGVARLLVSLLTAVAEAASPYPPPVAHGLAGSLVDLLVTLASERKALPRAARRPSGQEVRDAMAWRVRHFVNENLADRALGPEHVAARLHVSVRYVHKVFSGEGTTLCRFIHRRRLEECRRDLARRAGTGPACSLAAVARRWGFVNASHFSRSFRAAYGVSPLEWCRIRAGADSVLMD